MEELFSNTVNINIQGLSPESLAFVGDAVYELYIATFLVLEKDRSTKSLTDHAIRYARASYQADVFKKLEAMLTEEEENIYKRGRNTHGRVSSKSATMSEYRMATGLEALIGYLFMTKKFERLNEVMAFILKEGKERHE